MFRTTKDFHATRLSILVVGPSGSGKTRLMGTLPGRVLIVNMENGLLSVSSGSEIAVYDCTVDGQGKEMARNFRFQKLLHFLTTELPKLADKFDWICFDSLTEIAQNLVETLKIKYPDKKDALVLWGEYNDVMRSLIKQLRDYRPFNILLLALDSVDKDEMGRRFIGVDIQGKISQGIPALMDEVFYLKQFDKEDGTKPTMLITSNYQNITAKDRSGKLDQFEVPNMATIVAKINGTHKV